MVRGSRGRRRLYHSRAARDDRDGAARYSGRERRSLGSASRVEPWNTTSYPTPENIRGGIFYPHPEYKEDYHERGKQSVYL